MGECLFVPALSRAGILADRYQKNNLDNKMDYSFLKEHLSNY
jgi:hypothetical protein